VDLISESLSLIQHGYSKELMTEAELAEGCSEGNRARVGDDHKSYTKNLLGVSYDN